MNNIELTAMVQREEDLRAFRRAELSGLTLESNNAQWRKTWPTMSGWRAFFGKRGVADGMQLERPAYHE